MSAKHVLVCWECGRPGRIEDNETYCDTCGPGVELVAAPDWRSQTMTRDEVLSMKPGRELDALVARKLFGVLNPDSRWRLSEDISAAWEVAEQLQKQGYAVCIELLPYEETSVGVYEADPANQIAYAKSNKPAEAIAKAALLAVMGE